MITVGHIIGVLMILFIAFLIYQKIIETIEKKREG